MAGEKWNKEELDLLNSCDGKTIEEIKKIFPHRSHTSLRNKYSKMNIRVLTKNSWTDEEVKILKNNEYKTMPELLELLPKRNDIGIRNMASKLKIHINSRRIWTQEEIDIVNNAHNKLTLSQTLELLPNRTKQALKDYAKYNNIKFKRPTIWTDDDIDFLISICDKKISLKEVYVLFPDRDEHTVNQKIHELGLRNLVTSCFKKWTKEEDNFILENYYKMKSIDIAKHIGVKPCRITERANILGLDKKLIAHPFSDEELKLLDLIKDQCLSLHDICNMLPNKPIYSVRYILKKLKIKYNKKDYYSSDGFTKLKSVEERDVFDFIRLNFNVDISLAKGKKFKNKKYDEGYIPDFIIHKVNNIVLDKKLIIEYYGLYNPSNASGFVQTYVNKTHRKNEYYKSNQDIYFIDLYPIDLKNNFKGVRNKLTSFFMEKFNIDLKEAS